MKKYFVLLLAVMLACMGSAAWAIEYGAEGYESHGMTEDDAWEISSVATLEQVRRDVNNYNITVRSGSFFKLTNDLNLTSWIPINIGRSDDFTFDGGNHTITVRIRTDIVDLDDVNYVGLFGYVSSGTIKNLSVSGSIQASARDRYSTFYMRYDSNSVYAGGIAGSFYSGTIENCKFDGTITVTNTSSFADAETVAGGIVGWASGTVKIISCKVGSILPTTISATAGELDSYAGGLIGDFNDSVTGSKITDNYVRVTLEKATYTGNLFGLKNGNNAEVSNNTEVDPNAEAPEDPEGQDDPADDMKDPDKTDDTTDTTNPNEQEQTDNTSSGSSGSSGGGGGCNSFGTLGVMLMALMVFRKR